ncbi:ASCH domain-containing protein [Flavobacteriaceae bacterium]|nr:ASCH domain-containing protein [Flavobacteriaceae bacterium]
MVCARNLTCEKVYTSFWQQFLNTHALDKLPCPPSFYFCVNSQDSDACATLVVRGIKKAAAPSLLWFDTHKENRPEVGDYHFITQWDGTPVVVIQTTALAVIPFSLVGAGFAHAEGEGDRSLAQWQEVHRTYYAREMGSEGSEISDDFTVVYHHFQTVFYA